VTTKTLAGLVDLDRATGRLIETCRQTFWYPSSSRGPSDRDKSSPASHVTVRYA
jgi:hypothetical protein